MRLLVDPEIFFYSRCGMVRYYSRLLAELRQCGVDIDLPLCLSGSEMIAGNKESWKSAIHLLPFGRKRAVRYFERSSKKAYYKKISEGNYDMLLITSPVFEDIFLQFLPPGKPFSMVVHDTMQCVLGIDSFFDTAGHNGDKLAYLIRRSTNVVCISNTVQEDMQRLTGTGETKATVIYTGNLIDTGVEQVPSGGIPDNYILFVGERSGRKNFRSFVQAAAPCLKEDNSLYIVCTGSCSKWELDLFVHLGIEKQVVFFDAPDPVLVYLYKNAGMLAYPSLYEGFGLPVIEAMSLGCPVLTSAEGALAEIAGNAACFADPRSEQSMRDAIFRMLKDPGFTAELIQRGHKRALQFQVRQMAADFKASFDSALKDEKHKNVYT